VSFEVLFTPEALEQLTSERQWWSTNRPAASELFDLEVRSGLRQLRLMALSLPVFVERQGRKIRRRLLPRTRCHLYFEVDPDGVRVFVLSVWGARRGRLPRFPTP